MSKRSKLVIPDRIPSPVTLSTKSINTIIIQHVMLVKSFTWRIFWIVIYTLEAILLLYLFTQTLLGYFVRTLPDPKSKRMDNSNNHMFTFPTLKFCFPQASFVPLKTLSNGSLSNITLNNNIDVERMIANISRNLWMHFYQVSSSDARFADTIHVAKIFEPNSYSTEYMMKLTNTTHAHSKSALHVVMETSRYFEPFTLGLLCSEVAPTVDKDESEIILRVFVRKKDVGNGNNFSDLYLLAAWLFPGELLGDMNIIPPNTRLHVQLREKYTKYMEGVPHKCNRNPQKFYLRLYDSRDVKEVNLTHSLCVGLNQQKQIISQCDCSYIVLPDENSAGRNAKHVSSCYSNSELGCVYAILSNEEYTAKFQDQCKAYMDAPCEQRWYEEIQYINHPIGEGALSYLNQARQKSSAHVKLLNFAKKNYIFELKIVRHSPNVLTSIYEADYDFLKLAIDLFNLSGLFLGIGAVSIFESMEFIFRSFAAIFRGTDLPLVFQNLYQQVPFENKKQMEVILGTLRKPSIMEASIGDRTEIVNTSKARKKQVLPKSMLKRGETNQ